MTKSIPLSQGKFALVDDDDFQRLSVYKWSLSNGYAARYEKKTIYMHREVMSTPKGMDTDHIDHDGLNNTKSNLRVCTHGQNLCNYQLPANSTSGYKGVTRWKRDKNWKAQIKFKQKRYNLGYFSTAIEAAQAYDKKAKELFGEFANTNF